MDNWVIIRLHEKDGTTLGWKVLIGWSGGYADGDSWRMNSGIKSYTEDGDNYIFRGYSDSVYECPKGKETVRMNIAGVIRQVEDSGHATMIDFKTFKEEYEFTYNLRHTYQT